MRWDVTCTLITFRFQEVLVLFTKPTLRSFQTGFPKSTIVTFAPYFVTFGWSKRDLRGLRGVKWWSDLGDKSNPYAFHHSQHNSQEFDKDIYSIMTVSGLMGHLVQILSDYRNQKITVMKKDEPEETLEIKEVNPNGNYTTLVVE